MTFLTDLAEFGSAIAGIINGTKAKKWGRYRSWLLQEQPGIISEFFFFLILDLINRCFLHEISGKTAFFQNRYVVILLMTIAQFFYGIVFALVPAILCAAGALLLIFGFKITKEKVEKYQAEIDARA